jgi:hypothetical protein
MPGGERAPENSFSRVSDTIILVGLVPCPISMEEESVEKCPMPVPFMAGQKGMLGQGASSLRAERKRPRLTVNVGWVVVGPGYSTEPAVHASGETTNRGT